MTLEEKRERGDLIEVFKILRGHIRIDLTEFWEVRDARNGIRLVKELAPNGKRLTVILLVQDCPKVESFANPNKYCPVTQLVQELLDDMMLGTD